MSDPSVYFEVPPEDVDPAVRRQAGRWADRAAAELGLGALGITPAIRWFLAPDRMPRLYLGRKELDALYGPLRMAGQVRPQDPPGTFWLRADLSPDPADPELCRYVAHELLHVQQRARGVPFRREGVPGDDRRYAAEEADCEAFARDFVARLRGEGRAEYCHGNARSDRILGLPSRREEPMPMPKGYLVIDGQLVALGVQDEPTARQGLRDRLREKVGAAARPAPAPAAAYTSLSAFVQAAVLAKSAPELGGVLAAWERAVDAGTLAGAEADLALSFLETAHQRLERGTKGNLTRVLNGPPVETRAADNPWPGIEYGSPVKIGRVR